MGYRPNTGGQEGGVTAHEELTGNAGDGCHPISAITDLQDELDAKAPAHAHPYDATGAAAAAIATHEAANDPHPMYLKQAEADVLYAPLDHEHDAAYEAKNANIQAHIGSTSNPHSVTKTQVGLGNVDNTSDAAKPISTAAQTALDAKCATDDARLSDARAPLIANAADGDVIIRSGGAWTRLAKGSANQQLRMNAAGLLPEWFTAGAGSDPWTVRKLPSDFSISTTAVGDVTQGGTLLGFTPVANTDYMWEAVLYLRTATATVNPRVGFAWATGLTDGVCTIEEAQSATAQILAMGNINAALLAAVGGIPNTTQSWPCLVYGVLRAGATPSGNARVQLASETGGTNVTVKAGSYIRYRTY
jgi:hypothetical protein